jgi:hypothetical protein
MSPLMTGFSPSAPTVFLHIGTPKSATSYLQSRFMANPERAARQGLLWPGPRWGRHVRAADDLRKLPEGESLDPAGPWCRLADEARGWTGDSVLISMEWLTSCTPHQIAAAVTSLHPCRVEVICTARDLLRNFTAQWQEMTKNYRPWTWEQYVHEITQDHPGPTRQHFWRQQDVPTVLETWLHAVPADRVHLVTVPPEGSDPDLLWKRFCGVLGIDGSDFDPPTRRNASLGVVSTVLMRHLNVASKTQALPVREYKKLVQNTIGREVLARNTPYEDPISVSPETDSWLEKQASAATTRIEALGVDIVGDLQDLLAPTPREGREPSDVTDTELLELCANALVTLGARQQREITRLQSLLAQSESTPSTLDRVKGRLARNLDRIRSRAHLARQRLSR